MADKSVPCLELASVTFTYRRGLPAVFEDLNMSFHAGSCYAITGPSGCGKSTLLFLCGLLITPTGGRVLLDGRDVAALSDGERSRLRADRIGFVFQDAMLDGSRSVVHNVIEGGLYAPGRGRNALAERARALLARFGVDERARFRGADISGGQAQRVGLCRALVGDPAVILADEPTGNLDPDNGVIVLDALVDAAHQHNALVIVASHAPEVVDRCDRVVRLAGGVT